MNKTTNNNLVITTIITIITIKINLHNYIKYNKCITDNKNNQNKL